MKVSKGGKSELDFSRILSHRSAARERLSTSEMGVNKYGDILLTVGTGDGDHSGEVFDLKRLANSKESRIKVMRIRIVWKHWRALYRLKRATRSAFLVRKHRNLRLVFRMFLSWVESTSAAKKESLLKTMLENKMPESIVSPKKTLDLDPSLHSPLAYYYKRSAAVGPEVWGKHTSQRPGTPRAEGSVGKWKHDLIEGIDTKEGIVGPHAGDRKCSASHSILKALSTSGPQSKILRHVHHDSLEDRQQSASLLTTKAALQTWYQRASISSKSKSLRSLADGHFYLRSYKYREHQFISRLHRSHKRRYREKLALKLRYLDRTDRALHSMAEFTVARKNRRKLNFRVEMAYKLAKQQAYFDTWRSHKTASVVTRSDDKGSRWNKDIAVGMIRHHRMVMKMLGFIGLEKLVSRSKEKKELSKRAHDIERAMRTWRTKAFLAKWFLITTVEYKRLRRYVVARKYHAIPPLPETVEHRHQLALMQSSLDREWWQRIECLIIDDDDLSSSEKQRLRNCSSSVVAMVANNAKMRAWEVWIVGCLTNRHLYFSLLRKAMKSWRKNLAANAIARDILLLSSQHYHLSKSAHGFHRWMKNRIDRAKKIIA